MMFLRSILTLAVALSLLIGGLPLATAAHAQGMRAKHAVKSPSDAEKKKKNKEIDEAYRASLHAIPAKPKADPWGGMR